MLMGPFCNKVGAVLQQAGPRPELLAGVGGGEEEGAEVWWCCEHCGVGEGWKQRGSGWGESAQEGEEWPLEGCQGRSGEVCFCSSVPRLVPGTGITGQAEGHK